MKNTTLITIITIIFSFNSNAGNKYNKCSILKGKKNLYGLCNAYCYGTTKQSQESKGSLSVLEQYNKAKKESDPSMPCIENKVECTVFNESDIDRLINASNIPEASEVTNFTNNLNEEINLYYSFLSVDVSPFVGFGSYGYALVGINYENNEWTDYIVGIWLSGEDGEPSLNEFGHIEIVSKEEAQACNEILSNKKSLFPVGTSTIVEGSVFENFNNNIDCLENCPDPL